MKTGVELLRQFHANDGKRYAVIEGNRDCNRSCSYCVVPKKYNRATEATLDETKRTVDWLYGQGYRMLSYLGGEPLAPYQTREGITFFDHTVGIVEHAASKGMLVNVTTNGDYADPDKIKALRAAGLDTLSFSLHTYSKVGLDHLLKEAQLSAEAGVIPTVQVVFTRERTRQLPGIAAYIARHGVLFSAGLVQEKGGDFSSGSQGESKIPTPDEQKEVFDALLLLKDFGFVRNNRNYLTHAPQYFPNNWTCDPSRDTFLHIGAGGTVDVCSDVRSTLTTNDIGNLDNPNWRTLKRNLVANCGNCMFHCYYEVENPELVGDLPTAAVVFLIKARRLNAVKAIGNFAVKVAEKRNKKVDWQLGI